jgi:hypothetical protein
MYCGYKGCQGTYNSQCNPKEVIFNTVKNPIDDHPIIPRQLRGTRRVAISDEMQQIFPREMQAQMASRCATDQLNASVPSLPALQKARSLHDQRSRVSENVLEDLIMRCSAIQPNYVKDISLQGTQPVRILCWHETSLDILKAMTRCKHPIFIGIDSTSAPVQAWPNGTGVYYYYGIVLQAADLPLTSLCDIVTTQHTSSQLFASLFRWFWDVLVRHNIQKNAVTTDFNWATIHASTLSLNGMDIVGYLCMAWDILQNRVSSSRIRTLTIIGLGRSHIFKEFSSWPEVSQQKLIAVKRTWKVAFGRILATDTIEDCGDALLAFFQLIRSHSYSSVEGIVRSLQNGECYEASMVSFMKEMLNASNN